MDNTDKIEKKNNTNHVQVLKRVQCHNIGSDKQDLEEVICMLAVSDHEFQEAKGLDYAATALEARAR